MKINFNYFIAVLVVLTIVACSHNTSPTKTTTNNTVTPDPVMMATISEGKSIYESNCNKCHELFNPGKFNEQEWTKYLDWMAPKAKLTDAQKQTVFAYLSFNAKHKK